MNTACEWVINWAACGESGSFDFSTGGGGVFLAICDGDVPSDFPNPYTRLYLRPVPIRQMQGSTHLA